MKAIICAFLLGCSAVLFVAVPAQAYLDPGSGSMLLQLLLGGVAGLTVIAKLYWRRILTFLGMRQPEPEQTESAAPLTQADTAPREKEVRNI